MMERGGYEREEGRGREGEEGERVIGDSVP